MSQIIVIDLPAVAWRRTPQSAPPPDAGLPIVLSLLLALAFTLFAVPMSTGTSIAAASLTALPPAVAALALATAIFSFEIFNLVWPRLVNNPWRQTLAETLNARFKTRYGKYAALDSFHHR